MIFSNLLLASLASAAVIGLPLEVRQLEEASPELRAHLEARQNDDTEGDLVKKGAYYLAELEIGSPAQKVSVCFDTSSPLLWVPGANSTGCIYNSCVSSFDVSRSRSWRYSNSAHAWGGTGDWGKDTVSYAGASLQDFNVYVSRDTLLNRDNSIGVWGQSPDKDVKGSFVKGLAASGVISRALFSLNADHFINYNTEATEGTITHVYYGGFDKKKYQGPLTTIDTNDDNGIPLSGFFVNGEKVQEEPDHSVLLDTGGVSFDITNNTLGAVARANGGAWDDVRWVINCDSKPTLTYQFGYTSIDLDLTVYLKPGDNGKCVFEGLRIVPDHKTTLVAGPPLISRALVIYDNDKRQITIGQAKYSKESEVVEITGDIPGSLSYKDFLAGVPVGAAQQGKSPQSSVKSSTKSTSQPLTVKTSSVQSVVQSSVQSVPSSSPQSTTQSPIQSSAPLSPSVKTSAPTSQASPTPTKTSSVSSAKPVPTSSSTSPKPPPPPPTTSSRRQSTSLAIKTTSIQRWPTYPSYPTRVSYPPPKPSPTQAPRRKWCSFFGIICISW
ncbi:Acid protease [Yarrowia sp. C11]|nr:Acid protease [Yarrowia sp. C11]